MMKLTKSQSQIECEITEFTDTQVDAVTFTTGNGCPVCDDITDDCSVCRPRARAAGTINPLIREG